MRRPGDPDRCFWDDDMALRGPVRDLEDPSRSPGVVREFVVGNPGFGRGRTDCRDFSRSVDEDDVNSVLSFER